jgi:rfaE bifunctional protein kinase chain/domain
MVPIRLRQEVDQLLSVFRNRCVLVVGDLMLDEYLWGHIERISPEAPVPILKLVRRESNLGGAGNVAKNLATLGASVVALGVIGDDVAGHCIREELDQLGVDCAGVWTDSGRPSTRKSRLMSLEHGQQVFRFDEESPNWIGAEIEDRLIATLESRVEDADALLCSDYLKGVLTSRVLQAVFHAARRAGKIAVVAPKDRSPDKYRGSSVLVPNTKELARLAGVTPNGAEWLTDAASEVVRRVGGQSLLVTRGREGMSLFEPSGDAIRRTDIPTFARSVYDVTGAGDTVISVFTLAAASGADHGTAARLANVAAGIVVGKRGTTCVTTDEILHIINKDPPAFLEARQQEVN